MALSEAEKARLAVDLREGMPIKEAAEKYDVSVGTVYGIRRKLESGKIDTTIAEAENMDPVVMKTVVEEVVATAPPEVKKQADILVDGIAGLDKLKHKFQETGYQLATKIMQLSRNEDLTPSELLTLSKAFNETVQAFSTSATTINVVNETNVNSDKLSLFKASLRN